MWRIMVVEDEPTIQKLLQVNLSASGYEVMQAADGKQGLNLIEQNTPDLVILDVRMPVMSGWEFYKIMGRNLKTRKTPVLLITGLPEDIKLAEQGNIPCLTKPFKVKDILDYIKATLNQHPEFTAITSK